MMKTDLSYLPNNKQAELSQIVALIKTLTDIDMLLLFGSYARNDWVEEKYDATHYRYQSDIDILVIITSKSLSAQAKLERDIDHQLEHEPTIKTPVSVIVHDINFINRRLQKSQYFFTDIKQEGRLLFDSGVHQLDASKKLSRGERKKLAIADHQYYFTEAADFQEGVMFYLGRNKLRKAAFLLHQTAERLYAGILLVFTRYKPNTHDLRVLRKLTKSTHNGFITVFPLENERDRWLFKLLYKAYVDARYKPSYQITREELLHLIEKVAHLRSVGETLCQEKITSFSDASVK